MIDRERFYSKVAIDPHGCWLWTGTKDQDGYGLLCVTQNKRRKNLRAHRVAVELADGRVPEHLVVDHLCRNKACVCPRHLEAVSIAENSRRANWRSTCKRGHEFTTLPSGRRYCRECNRLSYVTGKARKQGG